MKKSLTTTLLILTVCITISGQTPKTVEYDKFTGTTWSYTKEVFVYGNRSDLQSVRLQIVTSDKFPTPTLLLTVYSLTWQFTKGCSIQFLSDEQRHSLECKVDDSNWFPYHGGFVKEELSIRSPDLNSIFKALKLDMRVGHYEFTVNEKQLKELRLNP
jgi:hypothetical protein